jgi:exopolysaccharide biosynthesis polyprenyl glycosylphosphotransferase
VKRKLSFLLVDGLLIAFSIGIAFLLKYRAVAADENLPHVYLIPFSIVVRWFLYRHFKLYRFFNQETAIDQFYYLFWAGTLASAADWLVLLVLKSYYLGEQVGVSREIILTSWALILASSTGWRLVYRVRMRRLGRHVRHVAIVGSGRTALEVRREIRQFAGRDLQVVGFVSIDGVVDEARDGLLGSLDRIGEICAQHHVDDLILSPEPEERSRLLELVGRCEEACENISIRLHPDLTELYVGRVSLTDLAGLPLVETPEEWRSGMYLGLKRILDIVIALVGLALFLIPGVLIALWIWIEGTIWPETRGPVFFCQQRLGKKRRPFRLLKFRTMIQEAEQESGPVLARENDPRITRVGRILRRTGLDELPQLWNILVGEMSLVGPRPERPEFACEFLEQEPAYALRFRIRPGLTGLAQIQGHYDSSVASKIRYDLVYLANITPLLDAKILFRTFHVVLTGRKMK